MSTLRESSSLTWSATVQCHHLRLHLSIKTHRDSQPQKSLRTQTSLDCPNTVYNDKWCVWEKLINNSTLPWCRTSQTSLPVPTGKVKESQRREGRHRSRNHPTTKMRYLRSSGEVSSIFADQIVRHQAANLAPFLPLIWTMRQTLTRQTSKT